MMVDADLARAREYDPLTIGGTEEVEMRRVFTLTVALLPAASQAEIVTEDDFRQLDGAAATVHQQRMEQIGLLGAYRGYYPAWGRAYSAPYPPAGSPPPAVPDPERMFGLGQPLPPRTADEFTEEELADARKLREDLLARVTAQFDLDLPTVRRLDSRLAELTPTELRALDRAWAMRQNRERQELKLRQQEVLSEAKLNLERAEAFRDHLQREFQLKLLQSQAEVEALRRAPLVWNSPIFPAAYMAPPWAAPVFPSPYW